MGLLSIAIICFIEIVFLHTLKTIRLIEIIFASAAIIEFSIIIGIINYGRKCREKARKKMILTFGIFLFSRFFIPVVIYLVLRLLFPVDMPEAIAALMAFIVLTYLNLVPLIWVYYFFLPYAESLSNIIERISMLDTIFNKYRISKREQEILKLIVDGKSNEEIVEILFISYHTVKNHIYNIYRKLGINTRYELIHMVARFQEKDK